MLNVLSLKCEFHDFIIISWWQDSNVIYEKCIFTLFFSQYIVNKVVFFICLYFVIAYVLWVVLCWAVDRTSKSYHIKSNQLYCHFSWSVSPVSTWVVITPLNTLTHTHSAATPPPPRMDGQCWKWCLRLPQPQSRGRTDGTSTFASYNVYALQSYKLQSHWGLRGHGTYQVCKSQNRNELTCVFVCFCSYSL